jgi:ribosomal protein L29
MTDEDLKAELNNARLRIAARDTTIANLNARVKSLEEELAACKAKRAPPVVAPADGTPMPTSGYYGPKATK